MSSTMWMSVLVLPAEVMGGQSMISKPALLNPKRKRWYITGLR